MHMTQRGSPLAATNQNAKKTPTEAMHGNGTINTENDANLDGRTAT